MLLSVVIPVYNVAPYIKRTLDSVVAAVQKCKDRGLCGGYDMSKPFVEVICVDDGSTDGSGEILDEYVKNDGDWKQVVRLDIHHQANRGVSAARNIALDIATGEWVMMLDGDDTWDEDLLVALFNKIEEHPDLEVVCFRCIGVDEAGECVWQHQRDFTETIITGDQVFFESSGRYSSFIWGTCDKMIRRRIIEKLHLRYKLGMRLGEDSLLAHLLFVYCDRVLLLPEIEGYRYLMHPKSVTHAMVDEIPSEPFALFTNLLPFADIVRRPGLWLRIKQIAAQAPLLGCGKKYELRTRAIAFLLDDAVFNHNIVPFLLRHGSWKSRLFAGVYGVLPRPLRWFILKQLGSCQSA